MHLFAQSYGPLTAAVVVIGLLIGWLLLRSHRYLLRRKRDDSVLVHTPRPLRQADRQYLDADASVLRWEVEMHETARDLSAQLDSKMGALQVLISEADRAAARLEAALRSTSLTLPHSAQPEPSPTTRATPRVSPAPDEPADNTVAAPDQSSAEKRHDDICILADYGYAAAEIAARLGIPLAEIELTFAQRSRVGRTERDPRNTA